MKTRKEKWACISITLLAGLLNLFLFVFLELKYDQFSWTTAIISGSFIIPMGATFMNVSGYNKKLWKKWKSLPVIIHQLIVLMCAFWIGFLVLKVLPVALKKEYEKE